ncbi:ERMES complex protein [Malassezia pachydermatis]|uniref:Maintenance of mitochondrial morphology protein 1 n=1 Tax=Malassezia pachydermatis TaxID=77020 RepID=A0A0M8MQG5_9BASI|nr:mmm1-required for mitochondrial shape and structure [Malassezia pachydermatis]KOS14777.1 mmm1-required for mitochondrial shape and structure [Malassezia pachydermatis]
MSVFATSSLFPAPSLSFVQGFVAGQAVLLALFLALFRYLFIAKTPQALEREKAELQERTRALQASLDARCVPPPLSRVPYEQGMDACLADLLEQTGYDLPTAVPESLDWFNILVAELLLQYRRSILSVAQHIPDKDTDRGDFGDVPLPSLRTAEKALAKRVLEDALNAALVGRTMDILGDVTVTDIDMGRGYPTFSNARVRPSLDASALRIEMDVHYMDLLTIGLDTRLWLNVPQRRFGSLAVALCLRIERIAGTLAIEIGSPAHDDGPPLIEARFSLYPDFQLDMHMSSVMGSKSKLYDIPKVEELILSRIRRFLRDRLVSPANWTVRLPSFRS